MEQHAVPQDITGFKFKLVGDMTLVQFGELAFGLVIGWIFWSSPLHVIFKGPLAVFFALLGVGLAFVPIEERPMHVWIFNFFKSIYRPTYYIWKRASNNPLESPPSVSKASALPAVAPLGGALATSGDLELPKSSGPWPYASSPSPSVPSPTENPSTPSSVPVSESAKTGLTSPPADIVSKEAAVKPLSGEAPMSNSAPQMSIAQLMNAREQKASEEQTPMTIEELVRRREEMSAAADQKGAIALSEAEKRVHELIEQNKELLMQIDEIRNKLYLQQAGGDLSGMTKDLDVLMEKKNKLASEIAQVRDQIAGVRVAPLLNPSYRQPPQVKKPPKIPTPSPKQAIVSLTSVPNVVNGLVLDNMGKPLDGAILIVKDEHNNSIRALRTNKVGQFIASTPLSNGNYTIEVEKANYSFRETAIALSGQVLDPLEIRAEAQEETSLQGAQVNMR